MAAHAVAIRDDDGRLHLFLRIVRAPSGIYVVFAAGQVRPGIRGKAYDPHSSWHRDGRVHEKSYDRTWMRRRRQPLDSFNGNEPFVTTSVDQESAKKLPACDPTEFVTVMEVPLSFLDVIPKGCQFHIDLVAPGTKPPAVGFRHEVLRRWWLSDGVPGIVVSFYALDLFALADVAQDTESVA